MRSLWKNWGQRAFKSGLTQSWMSTILTINSLKTLITSKNPIKKMENKKSIVDVDQVLAIIDQTLKEIREGLKPEELTAEERAEVSEGFMKVIVKAHQIKLKIKIDLLAAKHPDLSPRKAVVKLLSTLPEDLPASAISELVVFVAKEWEVRMQAVAA